MTEYVMVALGFANGVHCPHAGQYLKSFDFEAYGGQGHGTFTPDAADAKRFADAGALFEFWRTTSKGWPIRLDGRPNRPLTALSVSAVPLQTDGKIDGKST